MKCDSCGATSNTDGICDYCGSDKIKDTPPVPKKQEIIESKMSMYDTLENVHLIGKMNTIQRAINCTIDGKMNKIYYAKDCMVTGKMNTIHLANNVKIGGKMNKILERE